MSNASPGPSADVLPSLPRDDEGPVFAEPWQAQAFAMAVHLHEQGHFTWTEWAAALAATIEESTGTEYYEHWLATLETLSMTAGLTSGDELEQRRADWQRAAEATPHGQPIELGE